MPIFKSQTQAPDDDDDDDDDEELILRINSQASIFTAELFALNLCLDIIRRSKRKKFAIFSESLSGLPAINIRHLETGYAQKFITDCS